MQVPAADDGIEQVPAILVRPEEAARMLRVSRTEMFRLLGSREIPSILIGRRRRVPVAALDAYVASRLAVAEDNGAGTGL
jgi:excisionase family DNA binding protein